MINSWKYSKGTTYSKYNAKRTTFNGRTYASKKEAKRSAELHLLEKAGLISELKEQVPYILIDKSEHGRAIKYVADFVYIENGKQVVEDTKGFKTDVYRLKKRLMAERYGIEIKET